MKHVNLRLPDDIHAALTGMAEADRRSLNTMLIVLIEDERRRRTMTAEVSAGEINGRP